MPHSFVSALFHCVWSTKERRPVISADIQERLWPFLGGLLTILKKHGMEYDPRYIWD